MNNVSVSGRLVRDPDCKEFDDGKSKLGLLVPKVVLSSARRDLL